MEAGDLTLDSQGNLYGEAGYGGDFSCSAPSAWGFGCGTVFKIDASGHETVVHAFNGAGTNEVRPIGNVILDQDGNLYGTTWNGGDLSCNGGLGCGSPQGTIAIDKKGDIWIPLPLMVLPVTVLFGN
jgi:uncharacterized repeat protein (TIGR03803 family)